MADKKIVTVNSLKKGSYVIIDDAPCVVVDIKTSSPGKHGSAKANITAVGIVDGKKRSIIRHTGDDIEAPVIEKKDAQVITVNGNIATVMDLQTYETFDLEIPEELQGQIQEGGIVLYWEVLNYKILKQVKQ